MTGTEYHNRKLEIAESTGQSSENVLKNIKSTQVQEILKILCFYPSYICPGSRFNAFLCIVESLSEYGVGNLKVHKNENFFGFDFEISTFS